MALEVVDVEEDLVGERGLVLTQRAYLDEHVGDEVLGALVEQPKVVEERDVGQRESQVHVEYVLALLRLDHERVEEADDAAVERRLVRAEARQHVLEYERGVRVGVDVVDARHLAAAVCRPAAPERIQAQTRQARRGRAATCRVRLAAQTTTSKHD